MSGIYGIYRYDGGRVDPLWLGRMRNAMAFYGPDGGGCKIEGAAGMGHLLQAVNPEDSFEHQPSRSQRALVVSAVRLDNRETLLDTFKIPASEAPKTSDGHLVSLAFDRWGEEVSSHLEGDWSLAAWDAQERRLYLARCAIGGASLYYYEGKGFIAFASSLKALLALPGVVREPDWLHLAGVLICWPHNAELTAYKGFRCLLAAHAMTCDSNGTIRDWRYWSQEGREPLRYRRDEEYVEAFLEYYNRAVKACLRTQKPVASELSGGRDSGSVVALAAPILASQGRDLTAYTSVPCFPPDGADHRRLGNEWELAHATATMAGPNVKHVAIDAKEYGIIQGIEHYLDVHDGPNHAACNNYWGLAELEAASGIGAGVLLSGGIGNETVSYPGDGSALVALAQGDMAAAFQVLIKGEKNPWMTLKRQIVKPSLMLGSWAFRRVTAPRARPWRSYSALNERMASQLDLMSRMREMGHDPSFTDSPLKGLRYYYATYEFGTPTCIGSELSSWHSVSCVDPTANQSMFEFLLRVPDHQFYRRSERNFLMKRAFKNRLPEAVLYGNRKGLQAADLGHRILHEHGRFKECLHTLESLPMAKEILDISLLNRCLEDLVRKVDPHTTHRAVAILVRGMSVGLFLSRLADSRS